jgi:hypothetical protein
MSNYLETIVSRSSQSGSSSVTPSYKPTRGNESQITGIELFDETVVPSESWESPQKSVPKEQVQENSGIFLPESAQQQPPRLFHNSEEIKLENIIELPYFTRHIDRMIVEERNIISEKSQQSGESSNHLNIGKVPLIQENTLPNEVFRNSTLGESKISAKKLTPVEESFDEAKPVIKPVIPPAVKAESMVKTKEISKNLRPARLSPAQPAPDNNSQVHRKNNQQAPKLVIGKITVEIVPPVVQPSTKIITRVVQSPPIENHSKINRLSFGLGQL